MFRWHSRCSMERAVVTGVRGSRGESSRTLASRRSSIEDRRCGETNLELSPMKFLASASSEADRRATRRSKPPPGSSRARGSESLSMLREVGHPRSSSHAQFLRLALGVHAELVSLVKAFVDATAGFIGASRHHSNVESTIAIASKRIRHGLCRWGWMTPARSSRAAALGVGGRSWRST